MATAQSQRPFEKKASIWVQNLLGLKKNLAKAKKHRDERGKQMPFGQFLALEQKIANKEAELKKLSAKFAKPS